MKTSISQSNTSRAVWIMVVIMSLLLLLTVDSSYAEEEGYVSLYQYKAQLTYCSQKPIGDNWEENAYPCLDNGDEKNYKISEKRIGFKNLYDPTDARVVCARPGSASLVCDDTDTIILNLVLSSVWSPLKDPDMTSFPDAFRFYLPPGTIGAAVTVFTPRDTREGIVVRYGAPPDCRECAHAWDMSYYDKVSWDRSTQMSIDDLMHKEEDVYLLTRGGHALVITSSSLPQPLAEDDAGWVYIHKLPFDGDAINEIHISITVDRKVYTEWYEERAIFLDNGDPVSAEDEVCTADALEDCSKTSCRNAGYYWYDGKCNSDKACKMASECDGNEDHCQGSDYHLWKDGSCHEEEECRTDHAEGCYNRDDCLAVGKYWYNNQCNSERACEPLSDCDGREDLCTGSGYAYNEADGTCHSKSECRADHAEGCYNRDDCLAVGKYWYDNTCNPEKACEDPSKCDDKDHCTGSGYTYDEENETCTEKTLCDKEHLDSCNKKACIFYNGYFYDGSCHEERACEIASACDNEDHCTGSGYFYYDGGCHVQEVYTYTTAPPPTSLLDLSHIVALGRGTVSTPVEDAPSCDADHRDLCTEADCEKSGDGYWYDGSCNPEPRKQHKVEDYNDRRSKAPVDLGPWAWDGEVNAGEKLELTLNFPDSGSGKTIYAGIYFNNSLYFIDNSGDGQIISADVRPLKTNKLSALAADTLLAPVDICASLGAEYQGEWTVFFMTIDGVNSFHNREELTAAINDPALTYSGGVYSVTFDCGKQASPLAVAAPKQALPALVFDPRTGVGQLEADVVSVAAGPVLLQPRLVVNEDDVGKSASLFAYIMVPGMPSGYSFSSGATLVELHENLEFSQLFPRALDFCNVSNSTFTVYFGYILADGAVKYNAYQVVVR